MPSGCVSRPVSSQTASHTSRLASRIRAVMLSPHCTRSYTCHYAQIPGRMVEGMYRWLQGPAALAADQRPARASAPLPWRSCAPRLPGCFRSPPGLCRAGAASCAPTPGSTRAQRRTHPTLAPTPPPLRGGGAGRAQGAGGAGNGSEEGIQQLWMPPSSSFLPMGSRKATSRRAGGGRRPAAAAAGAAQNGCGSAAVRAPRELACSHSLAASANASASVSVRLWCGIWAM